MKLESIEHRALADVSGGDMFDSPLAILAIPLALQGWSQPHSYTPAPVPATRPAAPRSPQKQPARSWP